MNRFKLTPLLAALLSVGLMAAGPVALAADALPPLAVDAAFSAPEMAGKLLNISDLTALKGLKRVAVPLFTVEFITADNVSSQTSGFAAAGRARSSMYYKLLGVGEADFQAITNAMHQSLLAELTASGLEVVGFEQVQAAASYRKMAAGGSAAPSKSSSSMIMAPPGMAIYGFSTASASGGDKGLFGALASIGGSMSAVGAAMESGNLSKELDAGLIEMRLRVSFVQLSNDTKGFFARLGNTASTSGKVFPSIDNVLISVQNGAYRSTVTMKNTLTLDPAAFADVREKATTGADVAGAVALAVFKLAIGSSDSSSYSEMEAVADPVKYKDVVGAGLGSVNTMLVARLKTDR